MAQLRALQYARPGRIYNLFSLMEKEKKKVKHANVTILIVFVKVLNYYN